MERIKQIEERNNRHKELKNSAEILAVYELKPIMDKAPEDIEYLLAENKRLREEIGTSLYELERLERNLDLPVMGYVRNSFNGVVRTLQGALNQE